MNETREVLDSRADAVSRMTAFKAALPPVTVLHGDCRDVLPGLPEGCVNLVITDPPYKIGYQSNRRDKHNKLPKIDNDDRDGRQWYGMMAEAAKACARVATANGSAYVFSDAQSSRMADAWHEHWMVRRELAYVKGRGSGSHTGFVSGWEKILYMTLKSLDAPLYGHPSDAMWVGRTVKTNQIYPAQKDMVALEEMLRWSSLPGEVVLDSFAGSGSLGAANLCLPVEEQRKVILIESNADAVALMVKRLSAIGKVSRELP